MDGNLHSGRGDHHFLANSPPIRSGGTGDKVFRLLHKIRTELIQFLKGRPYIQSSIVPMHTHIQKGSIFVKTDKFTDPSVQQQETFDVALMIPNSALK